jgi:hypothetical protein
MDYEQQQFDKLTGAFKHYCPDWDEMAIDETMPEFDHCLCDKTCIIIPNKEGAT